MIGVNSKYKGNPSRFPKTNTDVNYVYLNMAESLMANVIQKVVIKSTSSDAAGILSIDDFTIGSYNVKSSADIS